MCIARATDTPTQEAAGNAGWGGGAADPADRGPGETYRRLGARCARDRSRPAAPGSAGVALRPADRVAHGRIGLLEARRPSIGLSESLRRDASQTENRRSSCRVDAPANLRDVHGLSRECFTRRDRKSTRLNSSHTVISYAVFCLKKKKKS